MRHTSKGIGRTLAQTGLLASLGVAGCSGGSPVVDSPLPSTSSAVAMSVAASSGPAPLGSEDTPPLITAAVSSPPMMSSTGDVMPGPARCEDLNCGPGQRCEEGGADAGAGCIDNTCEELNCDATQKCAADDLGGFVCVLNSCEASVDCKPEEFCGEDSLCQPDVCVAQTLTCSADAVIGCDSDGGGESELFTCNSEAYFTSSCTGDAQDTTGCTCEDDWDCPNYTTCEVGLCKGTGKAPSCTLPPIAFGEIPPDVELHWGGESAANDSAHDGTPEQNPAPWPASAHVVATPAVANLDDDNGDGLINELDFPEILFVSYRQLQGVSNGGGSNNGILRAIHGGGPNKGKDMFAVCGTETWSESMPITTPATDDCNNDQQIATRNAVAVADLDRDGVPEIVYATIDGQIAIVSNLGAMIYLSEPGMVEKTVTPGGNTTVYGGMPSIADLDSAGLPEIVIGREVYVLGLGEYVGTAEDGGVAGPSGTGLHITHHFKGTGAAYGMHLGDAANKSFVGPTSCVADIHPDAGQEVLAGTTLYKMPAITECADEPCEGDLVLLWDADQVNDDLSSSDGFCAIADVWGDDLGAAPGPANPPDGNAEAILIADGHLEIFEGATGTLILDRDLGGGALGGAPNVDDFDGDGFMEIASALSDFFIVVDLQEASAECPAWPDTLPRELDAAEDNPNLPALARASGAACTEDADCATGTVCNEQQGACVCLHNGWTRESDDDSSKITASSVFDFNGDGRAEVMYNDECELRVYDGTNGSVLYNVASRSRTAMENPIVADVDNDGNAEVVSVANTEEVNRCNDDPMNADPIGPNGLRVFGDPADSWVSARRIWNQFAYHVTNVTESGAVPVHEPESWKSYNGRTYNTYRSQPRSQGAAPDLQVTGLSLSSPDVECGALGDELDITFEITNAGDLRVGPGVQVTFYGTWGGVEAQLQDAGGPLTFTLTGSLEPGRSVIATVHFDLLNQSEADLPESVRVAVDTGGAAGSDFGAERECHEDNNDRSAAVEPGEPRPDISVELGEATVVCSTHIASVEVTVTNSGTADASGIELEIFAGDPASGGTSMLLYTIPEPIPAGQSITFTLPVPNFPTNREILLWGVVDPNNTITECNEGDNTDPADNPIKCLLAPQT